MRVSGVPFVQGRNGYTDSDGRKYGIAIHNTSNDATAEGEASYATRRTDGVSSHFYVDNNSVVQSLDTKVRAGHAGSGNGNNHAVAVEITGTNSKTRAWWLANVAWDQLARVLAAVCREYGIEPRRASVAEMKANPKVRAFYGHDDMRRAWGGTTHTDPGGNFPWDHLLAKVRQALSGEDDDMSVEASNAIIELRNALLDPKKNGGYGDSVLQMLKDGAYVLVKGPASSGAWIGKEVAALTSTVRELAAQAGVAPQRLAEIQERVDQVAEDARQYAEAEATRDAVLAELVRAGQSGELTAEQVLVKLRDLLPASSPTQG